MRVPFYVHKLLMIIAPVGLLKKIAFELAIEVENVNGHCYLSELAIVIVILYLSCNRSCHYREHLQSG